METPELLQRSHEEITGLRRRLEIAEARLEVFELCAGMVMAEAPRRHGGMMSPDIAWELQKALDALALKPGTPSRAEMEAE